MKKVILILSIIASTYMLNAAQINWMVTKVSGLDSDTASAGSTAYLINALATGYDLQSMTDALAKGDSSLLTSENDAIVYTTTTTQQGPVNLSKQSQVNVMFGDYSSGEYSFYTVLISSASDMYMITDKIDITYEGTGNITAGFDASSKSWQSMSLTPGGGGSGDVPEPTSGLLLLVGGALLALRRKQK